MIGRGRGKIAIVLLCSQLLTATALFVPIGGSSNGKDRSQPFPCMDRPCGCPTAEQCWQHCCCYSMKEKVAWARARGIEPPEFACRAAADEIASEGRRNQPMPDADELCFAPTAEQPATCEPVIKSCCHKSAGSASACETKAQPQAPRSRPKWVLGIMALECQGYGPLGLLSAVPSLLPDSPLTVAPPQTIRETIVLLGERPQKIPHPPRVPPPRLSASASFC